MKASNTLIKPFLDGILQDIRGFYPHSDFSYEQDWINNFADANPVAVVHSLARIGKALERALITGSNLNIKDDELQEFSPGAKFPHFLNDLWHELFYYSGRPRFVADDFTVSADEVTWSIRGDIVDKEHHAKALAVLCLRQFYLGLSKLSTLECLYLRRNRDRELRTESFKKVGTALCRDLRRIAYGTNDRDSLVLSRRRASSVARTIF